MSCKDYWARYGRKSNKKVATRKEERSPDEDAVTVIAVKNLPIKMPFIGLTPAGGRVSSSSPASSIKELSLKVENLRIADSDHVKVTC